MNHGGGHMEMPAHRCSMNMLWNSQIEDTCVVFRSWHITGWFTFLLSFTIILLLGVTYEWLRKLQRLLDIQTAQRISRSNVDGHLSSGHNDDTGAESTLLLGGSGPKLYPVPLQPRIQRAVLYGISTFLSFFLMLVFMTYNAYLISAVVIGAALGHFIYGAHLEADAVLAVAVEAKGVACC